LGLRAGIKTNGHATGLPATGGSGGGQHSAGPRTVARSIAVWLRQLGQQIGRSQRDDEIA